MGIDVESMCPLLQVFDMPSSIAFYRDVLGFKMVDSALPGDDCDWCLLGAGRAKLMLNTQFEKHDRPSVRDAARASGHSDTALYFNCRDLDAAWAHVRAKGIDAKRPVVRDYGMQQLYFHDPDGYSICLQWPAGEPSADGEPSPPSG
jgi:glyoxylase I family protein